MTRTGGVDLLPDGLARPEPSDRTERDLVRRLLVEPYPLAVKLQVTQAHGLGLGWRGSRIASDSGHGSFRQGRRTEQKAHRRHRIRGPHEVGVEQGVPDRVGVAHQQLPLDPDRVVSREERIQQH